MVRRRLGRVFVRAEIMWEIETGVRGLDQSEARTEAGQPITGRGHTLGQGWTPALPSAAFTTNSQFQNWLRFLSRSILFRCFRWRFYITLLGNRKLRKERETNCIIMVTDKKHDDRCFVKLADKTRCFMQIADNILIFILTTRSMLLSHCHCQARPVSAKTKFKLNFWPNSDAELSRLFLI